MDNSKWRKLQNKYIKIDNNTDNEATSKVTEKIHLEIGQTSKVELFCGSSQQLKAKQASSHMLRQSLNTSQDFASVALFY